MDFISFMDRFPVKLNEQQRSAVCAVDGPVLLLAVPGSGKTTVLVSRLGYMIHCCNIPPEKILTLTYTVAATNDMRDRFSSFFGPELGSRMEFRTINSICAGIIRFYASQIGKRSFELLNDEKMILGILSLIYQKTENEYPAESDLKNIRTLITYIKNMMLSDEEIHKLGEANRCNLLDIYKMYCTEMRKRSQMDFDDQMIYAYTMLKKNPQLLEYFQNQYPYICVDEAQDTSRIQHKIIALLASRTENLFMVGDEDQSIYGFRAAYPEALLSFEKDHPGAKVLLMEENFRSNANIVEAADRFIQKNMLRHEKHMKATRGTGSQLTVIPIKRREAQYSYLLKLAKDVRTQTCILYRDNESAIPLVDLLERNAIPYRIRNAELGFFSHRVVLDIQNILLMSMNLQNADVFEQIYYKLNFYLKKQSAMTVSSMCREEGISVFDAIFQLPGMNPYTKRNIKALHTHFQNMRHETPLKAINRIVSYMGYEEYLERTGMKSDKIYTLKNIASRTETIEEFLDRMTELKELIQNKENDYRCPFILSTIHGSKGLEYDNVYLMDVCDGIFPEAVPVNITKLSDKERETYEEERRLFYVGATRAKENLYLFHLDNQSLFIRQFRQKNKAAEPVKMKNSPKKEKTLGSDNFAYTEEDFQKFEEQLGEGLLIRHKKFGQGVITEVNENTVSLLFEGNEEIRQFNKRILFRNQLLTFL